MVKNDYAGDLGDDEEFNELSESVEQKRSGCLGCSGRTVGCGCVVLILVCIGGLVALFKVGFHYLQTSAPFEYPIELASDHPVISRSLGLPIEAGYMLTGSIDFNNDDGNVDMQYPISGPRGEATMTVKGIKTDGVWEFRVITCRLEDSQEIIDLAPEPAQVDRNDGDSL